jgi:hypothetical protein
VEIRSSFSCHSDIDIVEVSCTRNIQRTWKSSQNLHAITQSNACCMRLTQVFGYISQSTYTMGNLINSSVASYGLYQNRRDGYSKRVVIERHSLRFPPFVRLRFKQPQSYILCQCSNPGRNQTPRQDSSSRYRSRPRWQSTNRWSRHRRFYASNPHRNGLHS